MANILVCDDAEFMRRTLAKILEGDGHKVIGEAGDGSLCISAYKRLHPDIVLMDITMPDMDGITATKEIIAADPGARIIMVSSMGTYDKVLEAIQSGAKDFIVKPFEAGKILECINKYI